MSKQYTNKFTLLDNLTELSWYVALFFLIKQFGWLYGFISFVILFNIYSKTIKMLFGMEHLTGMDSFWFHDDERNYANIIAFMKFERFNADDFAEQVYRKGIKYSRVRSRVIKFIGSWWFSPIPVEEMKKNRDKYIIKVIGVHTEKQLADFMARQQSIRDDLDGPQWRCFLIEDYSATESIFVFKVHHSVADGIAFILFMSNLCDKPDVKQFPQITMRFPLWQRFLINCLVPFMVLALSFKIVFLTRKENNGINNDITKKSMTSLKKFAISKDIPIDILKKKCAELGVTINEMIFGMISQTMKQTLVKLGDTKTNQIVTAVPFSLRDAPKHEQDYKFENAFSILPVPMRLINDMRTDLKIIKNDLAYLKTSPSPFGYYYLTNLILALPHIIQRVLVEDYSSKLTMGFSNVPGPKEAWYVTGKKCLSMGFNIPLGGTVSCGWGAISHENNLKLMLGADRSCLKDVDIVM